MDWEGGERDTIGGPDHIYGTLYIHYMCTLYALYIPPIPYHRPQGGGSKKNCPSPLKKRGGQH